MFGKDEFNSIEVGKFVLLNINNKTINKSGQSSSSPAGVFDTGRSFSEKRITKEEINVRLSLLQKIKDKKPDEITEDDKQYLLGAAKYFNYNQEYLEIETDKKEIHEYARELYILTHAELVALDLQDTSTFAVAVIDEVSNEYFVHELGHLYEDMFYTELFTKKYSQERLSQYPDIQKEINRVGDVFRGKYDNENLNWKSILRNVRRLKFQNPGIIIALIDELMQYIEEIASARAGCVKYIKIHRSEIGEEATDKYLERAILSNGECRMNLSRLEKFKQDILQSKENVLVEINNSIKEVSGLYKGNNEFKLELQPALDIAYIYGNAIKVAYIWTNLFRNSIDAIRQAKDADKTRVGKLVIKTKFINKDNKGFIEVTVSDNGIGIPETLLQDGRIFQKGVTTKESGTGLGLYLIKQTVEELGGTIDVQSKVGEGTTFTIRLPIVQEPEQLKSSTSSPLISKPGGIDFRFMPIVTQSMDSLRASIRSLPRNSLQDVNLTQEWSDIERLLNSGIAPSTERLKEYFIASYYKNNLDSDMEKIVSCISDILRQEEESCCSTDPMLKDMLVVLGSGRSGEELKLALAN